MQRDTLIERYAKKVFGFAVRKSNSRQDAEDLSQSILTALCETDWEKKAIADMDGYIYRICLNTYYTRAAAKAAAVLGMRGLRRTSRAGGRKQDTEEARCTARTFKSCAARMMRRADSAAKRLLLFYYRAQKRPAEIAERLGVPESTLRWHLGEAKHRLKERMDMTDKFTSRCGCRCTSAAARPLPT